jgi:hypothetical protein
MQTLILILATCLGETAAFDIPGQPQYHADAFVCDSSREPIENPKPLHHGKMVRICISAGSELFLQGLDSFSFFQDESTLKENVVHRGQMVDPTLSQFDCSETMCVLETILYGDCFLSGGETVEGSGIVNVLKSSGTRNLRGSKEQETVRMEVKVSIPIYYTGASIAGRLDKKYQNMRTKQEEFSL